MSTPLIVFVICCLLLVGLLFLFKKERQVGYRYGHTLRDSFDAFVVRGENVISHSVGSWARHVIRQMLHYIFHTFLTGVARFLKSADTSIRLLIKTNKEIARKSKNDQSSVSKLEEVMAHKITTKLTPEEERMRKDRSLNG